MARVLSDLAELTVGHVGPMASEYVTDGVPFLRSLNIRPFRIELADVKYITPEFHSRLRKSALAPGDVVVVRTGAPGTAAVIPDSLPCSNCSDLVVIRPGNDLDSRYLAALINGISRGFVFSRTVGAVQQHFNVGSAREIPIPDSSLEEQRRIAGVLGAFDDLIDTNTQLAERTQSLAAALLDRAAALVPLSDVAEPVKSSLFRPVGVVEHYSLPAFDAGGLPEMIDGSAIKSGKQRVTRPAVLVSRLNPQTPRVWMAYPYREAAASTEFLVLAGRVDVAVEEVWATCSTDSFAAEMRSRVTGTTGSHQRVDKSAIPTIEVPDPRSLRSADREAVVSLVQDGHASRREAARLADVRDELLPLLMSGRVSVDEAWEAVP